MGDSFIDERAQRGHGGKLSVAPALWLLGPTATGKTELALNLAQRFDAEIISVDSALVYRGMDIGTAKPSLQQRTAIAHHLIDVCDPDQTYSAARFCADAQRLTAQVRQRGKLPLLVGGTMLYFKALREGLHALPSADAALRREIEQRAERLGWPALHAELARVDAPTAARLPPTDAQRIARALEVFHLTGRALSALHSSEKKDSVAPDMVACALLPGDRARLRERLAQRFDAMLAQGLVEEVQALRQRFRLEASMPSMRCVGYRQVWQFLQGDGDAAQLRERAHAATRQLAKRQLTWLRSFDWTLSVDAFAPDCAQQVAAIWSRAADS